jgi:hypothetical protein
MLHDQRKRHDRRIDDVGPPGDLDERRNTPERRLPDVAHVDFAEYTAVVSTRKYFDPEFPPPR